MKILKLYIGENKKIIFVLYFLTIIIVTLSFKVSGDIRLFFNDISTENTHPNLAWTLFHIVASYAVIFLLSIYSSFLTARILYSGVLSIRRFMMKRLLYTSFNYFKMNTSGKVWSELLITTNKGCSFYNSLLLIPVDFAEVCVYSIIIFKTSVIGGFIIIAFIPLIFLTTIFSGKVLEKRREESLDSYRDLSSWSVEMLSASKMVKTTSSYAFFLNKFADKHNIFNQKVVSMSTVRGYVDSVQNTIVMIAPLIVMFFSGAIGSAKSISIGDLIILYTFTPFFFNAFRNFYSKLFDFFDVKPSLNAINDVLSLQSENFGSMPLEPDCKISVRNFNYTIGDKQISIPDFEINPGDKILITGESGLGKSTFFNCLVGIIEDHHNTIFLNGKDIKSYDLYQLRKKIILVNQEHFVFSGTLKENLLLGLSEGKNHPVDISEKGIQDVVKLLRIRELYNRKHINNNKLSGGEKARINLGQALLRKPDILLIDETLSSVDEQFEKELIETIISKNTKMSVVCITHRLSVAGFFDKVISLL